MHATMIHLRNESEREAVRHLNALISVLHKAGVERWTTSLPKGKGAIVIAKGDIRGLEELDYVERTERIEVTSWN